MERVQVITQLDRRTARRLRGLVTTGIAALSLVACLGGGPTGTQPPPAPAGTTPVLFVGNSLTYVNDVPGMVEALGASDAAPIWVQSVAYPDADLGQHLADGAAARAIAANAWKVVVLQQGPSSLPENRAALRQWTSAFAQKIRAAGARPGLYAVWPQQIYLDTFDRASESYALAAEDVDGLLFPVGEAWRAAWRLDPNLQLYSIDGLHASVSGSYLAAIVIYAAIADRSPVGLPGTLRLRSGATVELPAARAALLQAAAAEAIATHGRARPSGGASGDPPR